MVIVEPLENDNLVVEESLRKGLGRELVGLLPEGGRPLMLPVPGPLSRLGELWFGSGLLRMDATEGGLLVEVLAMISSGSPSWESILELCEQSQFDPQCLPGLQ